MAFNFGSSTQSTFGGPAAKPTGFGTAFGAATTTASSTGFGFGSSTFGQPQQQQAPAFGSSFGVTPSSAPPAFGASFGSTPATSVAPTFGAGFGAQPQQTTGPFGAVTSKPNLFGSSGTTLGSSSLFGSTPGQQPSLFGSTATTSAPSLFGTTATTSAPLFGSSFGQTGTTTTPSLFGSSGSTFGGGGGGLFGTTATTAASLFGGTGFGATTATTASGFGGFGGTSGAFGTFGGTQPGGLFATGFGSKPTVQQPAQQPLSKDQLVVASIYAINVFNDERDDILKKWNLLQASWGTGKGYYNTTQPPVDYTPQNPFFKFKAIGYNVIPEHDNLEGIVRLVFSKKVGELKNQQEVLKNGIGGILGNKPNLIVDISLIKAISETMTEVKICVSEKNVTGQIRKVPATDLSIFLNQPQQKQQLSNVGVVSITPYITPSKAELEEYLKTPPQGIDQQMWNAAIQDNPNPKKYIPVPINGFSDLRARMLNQEYQTGLHQAFLEKVNKEITELKTKHAASEAQIFELRQRFLEMQHRILRVLVRQESTRKVGMAIQPEEEILRGRLETMHTHLNVPTQFKGHINELLAHVKMVAGSQRPNVTHYRIDADAQTEISQFLKMEQNGIAQLVKIVNNDLQALKIINEGLRQTVPSSHNM